MRGFAGSCRFVFNRALALQKELFELSGGVDVKVQMSCVA
jgi:hypothetical protein